MKKKKRKEKKYVIEQKGDGGGGSGIVYDTALVLITHQNNMPISKKY